MYVNVSSLYVALLLYWRYVCRVFSWGLALLRQNYVFQGLFALDWFKLIYSIDFFFKFL